MGRVMLRLLWRPEALWFAVPLCLGLYDLSRLGGGTHQWLTHYAIYFPATVGFGLSMARQELLHAPFSFTLPDLGRQLLMGTIALGMVAASIAAWLAWQKGGLPLTMVVLGIGCFWFAVSTTWMDRLLGGFREVLSIALGAVFIALRRYTVPVEQWAAIAPVAFIGGALILMYLFSRHAARVRVSRQTQWLPPSPLYWFPSLWKSNRRSWSVNLASNRLWPWLRAAAYERSQGSHPAGFLSQGVVVAVWAHVFSSVFVLMVPIFLHSRGRLQFQSKLLYPISRTRKANLFVLGSTTDTALLMLVVAACLWVVEEAGIPTFTIGSDATEVPWGVLLALGWAWSPLTHSFSPGKSWMPLHWIYRILVFGVLVFEISWRLSSLSPGMLAVFVAGIGVTTHLVYWLLVRMRFEKGDL